MRDRVSARGGTSATVALFLSLFAAQSSVLVLSPILPTIAHDLGVSIAAAGQLRAVSGAVAGGIALLMPPITRRFGLRDLLLAGLALLCVAALGSALSPTFAALAAAQAVVGVGLALVLSCAVAAAGEWTGHAQRARVLSWALVGQPASWIVGMPLVGFVVRFGWRWAWIALPLVASVAALAAVAHRPADPPSTTAGSAWPSMWARRDVRVWAAGELLAYAAWSGTLVYAGALFVESYDVSALLVGVLLAIAAVAYVPGNFLARRWVDGWTRPAIVGFAISASALVAVFGGVRSGLVTSGVMLALLGFVNGARTIAGSAFGLDAAGERKLAVMSLRSAALQFGYLIGAAVGGAALSAGGYGGLGVAFAVLFAVSALVHVPSLLRERVDVR